MKSLRIILAIFIPIFVLSFGVSLLYKWNYIQHTQHFPDEFQIPNLHVGFDANKNNIDDSTDIVEGAKQYTSKNPTHEAFKEYESGFPTGKVGSNADPIAYAFTYAGYNMQNLVYQDIQKNPEAYSPNTPHSKNGAFRSVENLYTYFSRYADAHDNDYYNIKDWQTGDVVFFEKNHAAIVADRVNNNGVRFVIHLFWKYQAGYYQDVLETNAWGKVIGHYRATSRMLSPKTDNASKKQSVRTEISVY
jgi:hypothetical protein